MRRPMLLDLTAFEEVVDLLTHYSLKLTATEWAAGKRLAENIQKYKAEEHPAFDPAQG